MKEKYEYDYPEDWHFDNVFDFTATPEWEELGYSKYYLEQYNMLYLPDELADFVPPPEERTLTFGDKTQRLIFYIHNLGLNDEDEDAFYTPTEEQMIQHFKIHCKINGYKVPEVDEEILRNLYARKLNNDLALQNILDGNKYRKEHFPIALSKNVRKMLENGTMYI